MVTVIFRGHQWKVTEGPETDLFRRELSRGLKVLPTDLPIFKNDYYY